MQARWYSIFIIIGNIISSVGIVLSNKYLMQQFRVDMTLTLTSLHFLLPFIIIETSALFLNQLYFEVKTEVPYMYMVALALANVGSISFNNLSLAHNSIGFYQTMKLLCIPCTMVLQLLLYAEFVSSKTKASLVILTIGVGIATVSDMSLEVIGALFGILATLTTSFAQILNGKIQAKYGLTPFQVLQKLMLPHFILTIIAAVPLEILPIVQNKTKQNYISEFISNPWMLICLVFNCILAATLNFFAFATIGRLSPLTHQVVGHAKTVLILVMGFIFFPVVITGSTLFKQCSGIVVALLGVAFYSYTRSTEHQVMYTSPQDSIDSFLFLFAPKRVIEV